MLMAEGYLMMTEALRYKRFKYSIILHFNSPLSLGTEHMKSH